MGNYVNEIMFKRPLSINELTTPFTVVFTDIPSTDTATLTLCARRGYGPTDDPGTADVSGWCTVTTHGAYRAVTVARIKNVMEFLNPGNYRIAMSLTSSTTGVVQDANIIIPVIDA
jgi:hypothetical protein